MFPDCRARPANILPARYSCSRARGEEASAPAGPRELLLTPRRKATARASPGSPPARRVLPSRVQLPDLLALQ
jgi:hypothetical protein